MLQRGEQVDDLRLDRDVERRHRLVGDDEVGVDRERARDADALALAARELVRDTGSPRPRAARRSSSSSRTRASASFRVREVVHAQRLADDAPDAVARVERRERILEDHLHPAAERPQLALAEVRDVLAVEHDRAGGRLVEAQDRAADRRLPAARLADEAERLAAPDRERDVVDRLHVADVAVEHDAALDREPDREVLELDERAPPVPCSRRPASRESRARLVRGHRVEARARRGRASTLARAAATSDVAATARSRSGSAAGTGSRAARWSMSRGAPAIGWSWRPRGVSRRGTLWSRPSVYGCRGAPNSCSARAGLDERARVHHVDALAHPGDDAEVVRDQDQRRVALGDERAQELEDLRLDRDVERRRRLVGDQELRLARERHRDHHPLAHPARELVRVVAEPRLRARDPDLVEQLGARASAALRSIPKCVSSASRICRPIVSTGFRLVIGSWKIIAISLPAHAAAARGPTSSSSSRPSKRARAGRRRARRAAAGRGSRAR